MDKKVVVAAFDRLLKPLGFARKGRMWNRRIGLIVSAIDIQTSKAADSITVNLGVLDPEVYLRLWGREPRKVIDASECTVFTRAGMLIDNRDKWWPIEDTGIAEDMVAVVTEYGLPFLERMHTREALEGWIVDTEVGRKHPNPVLIMNLAILKHLSGEEIECCEILRAFEGKVIGAWRTRCGEIAKELGCP
jgi:hypothetical protein